MEMQKMKGEGGPEYRDSPSPHFQHIAAQDDKPAPALFSEYSESELDNAEVSRERYTSAEFLRLERERMWPRVWQMACREEQIPEPGDCIAYDGPAASILVVRGENGEVRAFYNSCPHRGMKLCLGQMSVEKVKCPFHSIRWTLDGKVDHVPARWDFADTNIDDLKLAEVRADVWQGFVFVNQNADAPPLAEYLGKLVPHFEGWDHGERYVESIIRRPIRANWKSCIEAFLEAYHLSGVHAQALPFGGESSTQYDVWPDQPHVSRFLEPVGFSSDQYPRDLSEQEIVELATKVVAGGEVEVDDLPEGVSARQAMVAAMRASYSEMHDKDYSDLSDVEAGDAIQYHLFPNFIIFRSLPYPFIYRFLPDREDPGLTMFEFYIFRPKVEGEEVPEVRIAELEETQSYADADMMPPWQALIYDQDAEGLKACQEGMRDGGDMPIRYTRYQESRIRLLHHTLGRYVSDDPSDAPGF
ncbi:(2Fe-2S)-binding protein [Novosphingobium marinum]|uniref:Phenylpropionate dioxygenase-like ring-hydroxylating dioxygenase large terminal subunit n=1 Tax=Novosphingobium marinum TaxID=1514948 RepID=A0A7Z0BTE1_9SPHN|nr:aromatic ring-hydroxylating dioxygenase subunit alpha [Novosphingobium marinum]NYH93993.1 phenylpropionate dioxygenase-like ring-hydroxylating dioxygenase large terminal subunit [Novosphingobium marinum]GGC18780.1 (2Fe-2S)-binding protein [Novosphingobium marinum]